MQARQKVLSINMNSFGGRDRHLMDCQYYNREYGQYRIDWEKWAQIDKTGTWKSFQDYIRSRKPDFLFVQEMLISRYEEIDFLGEMKESGYRYVEEGLPERGNYSLTMAFYRGERPKYIPSPGNYRGNRTVICQDAGALLCGTHFPYESDQKFLRCMDQFLQSRKGEDLLLIGDLNANDPTRGNKQLVNALLEEGVMIDLWTAAGHSEAVPTEAKYHGRLDYALASRSLAGKVQSVEIDPFPMESGMTDHAAVIVDLLR